MPDLRLGAAVSDDLWLDEYDLWQSGDMETALFEPLEAAAEGEGLPKKKNERRTKTRSGTGRLVS